MLGFVFQASEPLLVFAICFQSPEVSLHRFHHGRNPPNYEKNYDTESETPAFDFLPVLSSRPGISYWTFCACLDRVMARQTAPPNTGALSLHTACRKFFIKLKHSRGVNKRLLGIALNRNSALLENVFRRQCKVLPAWSVHRNLFRSNYHQNWSRW